MKIRLKQYVENDSENIGGDITVIITIMQEKLEVPCGMFHKLDYSSYMETSQVARMRAT